MAVAEIKTYSEENTLKLIVFGRSLRYRRELHNVNIQDMSDDSGIPVRELDAIECGFLIPDEPCLMKLQAYMKKLLDKC